MRSDPDGVPQDAQRSVAEWFGVALVLVIWPFLFLIILFGYLNLPVLALIGAAALFFSWRIVRQWPGALRRALSGKYRQH